MKRLAIVGVGLLAFAGCAQEKRGTIDAPINHPTNNGPADIINMPNDYANLAVKCDGHGHRIYVTTREAAPVVVDDPTCPGGPRS